MEIRETATYPFPIWRSGSDDFNGAEPQGSYSELKKNENNEFLFAYDVTFVNDGIKRLIEEGKAQYKCIVECISTYYLQVEKFNTPHMELTIPADKIQRRFTIKVLVVAVTDINGCDYLDLNEVYEGVAYYPKGAPVASYDKIVFNLQQIDNGTDLSRIFRTLDADVDAVTYDVEGHHIVIKYPQDMYEGFKTVEGRIPAVIESVFVFPALVYGLVKLKEYATDTTNNYDWVFYLKEIVDDYYDRINQDVPEDYILDIDDANDIANWILKDVQKETISDLIDELALIQDSQNN